MTIELPKRVAENIDRFAGRQWLLPKVLEWWDRREPRLMVLTGGPGTGKSMVAAWLAGFGPPPKDPVFAEQLARVRRAVGAAHFCQAASRNISPQAFAASIAGQLTTAVPGFGDALAAILRDRVQISGNPEVQTAEAGSQVAGVYVHHLNLGSLGDEFAFDQAFARPLKKLYESGYGAPMLLVVDALDEALTYAGVTTTELLSRLADLPPQVRILVTTRDDPRVLTFFRDTPPLDLIAHAPEDVDDVRAYIRDRLSGGPGSGETKRVEFAERLARHARGVFLYAALVLDAGLPDVRDLTSHPLPDGLNGLYREFLRRELVKDEGRWFEVYEPLLGLLAVAQGDGLSAQQLSRMIGRDVRRFLRACKQYLAGALPDGPFKPFHKSFADFLLEEGADPDFHIDAGTMHRRIVAYYQGKASPVQGGDGERVDVYALRHYALHLVAAGSQDDLVTLLTASPDWMNAKFNALRSDESLIADVELALAHTTDVLRVAQLCASAHVVRRKAIDFHDDDLQILALLGRVQEARAYARLRPHSQARISALISVARGCDSADVRSAVLEEALGAFEALEVANWERASLRGDLAIAFLEAGRLDRAEEIGRTSPAFVERHVEALVARARFDDALKIARSIDPGYPESRARLLGLVAGGLGRAGDERAERVFGEALTVAREQTSADSGARAKALGHVAEALDSVRDPRASQAFDEALELAYAIPGTKRRFSLLGGLIDQAGTQADVLHRVAVALARAGRATKALEATEAMARHEISERLVTLRDVAIELSAIGANEASTVFARLKDLATRQREAAAGQRGARGGTYFTMFEDRLDEPVVLLVDGLTRAGALTEAEDVARTIVSPRQRANAFRKVVAKLAETGDRRAPEMFTSAVDLASSRDRTSLASLFPALTSTLARGQHFAEARRAAVSSPEGWTRWNAMRDLGVALAEAGRVSEAAELSNAIDCGPERVPQQVIMSSVVTSLARAGRIEEALAALPEAGVFRDIAVGELLVALARIGRPDDAVALTLSQEQAMDVASVATILRQLTVVFARSSDERSRAALATVVARLRRCADVVPGGDNEERVLASGELAVALAEAGASDADQVFAQTVERARSVTFRPQPGVVVPVNAQRRLVSRWVDAGYLARARELALQIESGRDRDDALRDVAHAFAQAGDFDAARAMANAMGDDEARQEVLAEALLCSGRVSEALKLLERSEPYDFPRRLIEWAPALEKATGRPALAILKDVFRILAWSNSGYGELIEAVTSR